jgi:hypothetical protein
VSITKAFSDILIRVSEGPTEARVPKSGGAPFGTPEENKLVESAAIDAVTRAYLSDKWTVVSHEDRNYGYDLHCTRDGGSFMWRLRELGGGTARSY